MSETMNNPAYGDWDDLEKELFTPEEIAESNFHAALIGALCDARDEGKITVDELQKIEDIEEPELWLDKVMKTLFSLGKTFLIVSQEQDKAS